MVDSGRMRRISWYAAIAAVTAAVGVGGSSATATLAATPVNQMRARLFMERILSGLIASR